MTCGGCSGAVERVLKRAKESGAGVNDYDVSLENQSVNVFGTIGFADLTARIEKTGKKVRVYDCFPYPRSIRKLLY